MKTLFTQIFLALLLFRSYCSDAQQSFVEGEINYSVRIESVNPKLEKQISTGILKIMLKGNSVLKELSLTSGFKTTQLFDNGKVAYSLRNVGEEKYAIQMDPVQLKKNQEKCVRFTTEEYKNDMKAVAGFNTEKAKLFCNDAVPVILYYTKDWSIGNEYLFERFPYFRFLPLAYDIKHEDGSLFHFELLKIEAKPLDNSAFKLPEGYKIISSEEFQSWRH